MRKYVYSVTVLLLLCISLVSHALEWPGGDWSSRVAWEAKMAWNENYANTGVLPYNDWSGASYYGSWDYPHAANGLWALDRAKSEVYYDYQYIGDLGPDGDSHFLGGQCTFFVRLVLFRSSYWTGNNFHLTMMSPSVYTKDSASYTTTTWSQVQPGWIFITSANMHMAIAEKPDTINGVLGWWVIDSNSVGSTSSVWKFRIARHFISNANLTSKGYWAWRPHLAISN